MEGMAQGKPFVVTDIRGNRDIIENNINGYLVEVNNIIETAKLIKKIEEEKNYKRMEENNLKSVEKYSIEKILKNMEGVYSESSINKS